MDKRFAIFTRSPLWAIRPEALTTLFQLTESRGGNANAKPSIEGRGQNKIAIIPIHGVLTKDGTSAYGSNYNGIATALESAAADPDVNRIILSVDSPGGEVNGLPETAAVLARVAKVKPVSAIVEGCSASAAYWLTSQAHDITLTPSGEVGSVGVRMMHVDMSRMLDNEGVKITELSSGDFKTEWSPYKPLSKEATADMQPRIEAVHNDFINSIFAGRGTRASAAMRRSRFGEGRMFSAKDALAGGLVDKLQAPADFYRSLIAQPTPAQPRATAVLPGRSAHPVHADVRSARFELELARRRCL